MKELDNFIYFDICLFAIDKYNSITVINKQSNFHYYCQCFKTYLLIGNYQTNIYHNHIFSIINDIKFIYHLTYTDAVDFVTKFFINEKYTEFSEAALLIKHYFRNSFL